MNTLETTNSGKRSAEEEGARHFFRASAEDFKKIPGSPLAYWVSNNLRTVFSDFQGFIDDEVESEGKNVTTDNAKYIRIWWEIDDIKRGRRPKRWFPFAAGGAFRKWSGNNEDLVDFSDTAIRHYRTSSSGRLIREEFWYQPGITWSKISSSKASFRVLNEDQTYQEVAILFDGERTKSLHSMLGVLNSKAAGRILDALSPTLNYQLESIKRIPFRRIAEVDSVVDQCIALARDDWDNFETSWDFKELPLLRGPIKAATLSATWQNWDTDCRQNIAQMKELEEENNRLWIEAYKLQDELTPEVPEDEITLARANERDDMAAFISYAVGCMFGRYSLEKPGLILANQGETTEDYWKKIEGGSQKAEGEKSFRPDENNILPILDGEWFEDDIVGRFREFLRVTFGDATFRENLRFIEEALGKDIRKYFVSDFYKDHVSTYKKRPIYWLFSSPKKSFQALIYMHRYNRDTVNLLLNDYLREFQNKLRNRRNHLNEILASESTSARDKTSATKEQTKIDKMLTELADWERDVIYPLAAQRIEIDLDDGVKQNYPKFGDALAKISGLVKKED